jgi:hypothetical protein
LVRTTISPTEMLADNRTTAPCGKTITVRVSSRTGGGALLKPRAADELREAYRTTGISMPMASLRGPAGAPAFWAAGIWSWRTESGGADSFVVGAMAGILVPRSIGVCYPSPGMNDLVIRCIFSAGCCAGVWYEGTVMEI